MGGAYVINLATAAGFRVLGDALDKAVAAFEIGTVSIGFAITEAETLINLAFLKIQAGIFNTINTLQTITGVEVFPHMSVAIRGTEFAISKLSDTMTRDFGERLQELWVKMQSFNQTIVVGGDDIGTYREEIQKLIDELAKLVGAQRDAKADSERLGEDIGSAIGDSASQAITQWEGFRNLLGAIGQDIFRLLFRQSVTKPLAEGLGGFFGDIFGAKPAAHGAVFSGPVKFAAKGAHGFINDTTIFPMNNGGVVVAGEAGREVSAPVVKTPSGNIGVGAVQDPELIMAINNQTAMIGRMLFAITSSQSNKFGMTRSQLARRS